MINSNDQDFAKPLSEPTTRLSLPAFPSGNVWRHGLIASATILALVSGNLVFSRNGNGQQMAEKAKSYADQRPGMVYIPGGTFMMGSDEGEDDEKPVHQVTVNGFYMDKYEVTVAQYYLFITAIGYRKPENWEDQLHYFNRPVVYVTWFDAIAYAKWAGKRLPTEAEWEYAARGGYTGVDGKPAYRYPWGNEARADKANFDADGSRAESWENAKRYLQEVGAYAPNGFGLYDMAGNVWEWCADWYNKNYYGYSAAYNPQGPTYGMDRVVRGGSWRVTSVEIRCADRGWDKPSDRYYNVGFRCVQDAR
jgi:formylglycine-generating enzyme required for sulfatase activity